MKKHLTGYLYIFFIFILLLISTINIIIQTYNVKLIVFLLLSFNIANVIKYRSNKNIFFISLMLLYFNFSVLICKYIYNGTKLLEPLYNQLFNKQTMGLSINLLLLYNTIIYLPICLYVKKNNKNNVNQKIIIKDVRLKSKLLLSFKLLILAILMYHIFMRITYNTALFEYLFIIFIFAFYIAKGDKKQQRIFEILLIICCIYSLYIGERIGVLQFLISDFVINYLEIFNTKKIIIFTIIGICFFTFMGVYGDILDSTRNFNDFTLKNVLSAFSERRFALDTAVSAYFSSASMIDLSNLYESNFRFQNFKDYFTKYLFLGDSSGYTNLNQITEAYQVNYGGGFIIGYFYFWLGTIGVILIALYIGFLMRTTLSIKSNSSNFIKTYSVFFISSLPRWYLYVPSLLFRGTLLFILIYLFITILINRSNIHTEQEVL